jgi:hypothetical protein
MPPGTWDEDMGSFGFGCVRIMFMNKKSRCCCSEPASQRCSVTGKLLHPQTAAPYAHSTGDWTAVETTGRQPGFVDRPDHVHELHFFPVARLLTIVKNIRNFSSISKLFPSGIHFFREEKKGAHRT